MSQLAAVVLTAVAAMTLVPACGAYDATGPGPLEVPPTETMRRLQFAWPVPCRATVEDMVEATGRSGTTRLQIRLQTLGPRDQLLLSFDEATVVEIDGASVRAPQKRAPVLPGLLLSSEGSVGDTTNLTNILEQTVEVAGQGHRDAERSIRATLESPFAKAQMHRGVRRYWRHWVELWDDLPLPEDPEDPDDRHSFDMIRTGSDGIPRTHRVSVHRKPDPGEGSIELWQVRSMNAEDAAQLIGLRTMESLSVVSMRSSKPTVTDASITTSAGARLDAASLQPQWVEVTTRVRARINGLPTDSTDRHRYKFTWQPQ